MSPAEALRPVRTYWTFKKCFLQTLICYLERFLFILPNLWQLKYEAGHAGHMTHGGNAKLDNLVFTPSYCHGDRFYYRRVFSRLSTCMRDTVADSGAASWSPPLRHRNSVSYSKLVYELVKASSAVCPGFYVDWIAELCPTFQQERPRLRSYDNRDV